MRAALVFVFALWASCAAAQEVTDWGTASLAQVNALRAEAGAGPVAVDTRLTKAAAAHARDMAKKGYFSHTGANGSTPGQRAKKAGFGFCFIAENLAKGPRDLNTALAGWMKSPGHRKNLLDPRAVRYALIEGPERIWVMLLGADGC